jgi:hypothetical protein
VTLVTIAAKVAREANGFTLDVGRVVLEHYDVLVGNSFLRARAPEFTVAVLVLAVNRSEDHRRHGNGYYNKQDERFLHYDLQ